MLKFDPTLLTHLMANCLAELGVCSESIYHVTSSLIQTSLRGVDSHGINLFPHYARAVTVGRVNAQPVFKFTQPASSSASLDADHGFGHHAGAVAMAKAIFMAHETGVGAVSVRNSTHFGAAAYFGLKAAESECIGFAFTNADSLVKVPGGKSPFFGTNPICFTAPLIEEEPFCLDMATSMVSWNKINNYRREKKSIPNSWAFDEHGQGVTDPELARSLNPAGDYKGFGLGMMVDILCGLLAGGLVSNEIVPMYQLPLDANKRMLSHFFVALDIEKFTQVNSFKARLQMMVDTIRSMPPTIDGQDVLVAGDPEKKSYLLRSSEGIPIDDAKFAEFIAVSPTFEMAVRQ